MFFRPIIFLTQTYLDLPEFSKFLAYNFYQKDGNWLDSNDESLESLAHFWQSYQTKNYVKLENFVEKQDFTQSLMEYYTDYTNPFLLFLGDLDAYSAQLQEGMLRFLEEPPKNLQIILFSQNKNSLLPTVDSRSQKTIVPVELVYRFLDSKLLEKVKAKLPPASDSAKNLIQGQKLNFEEISKLEREEIDFWLWQVQKYLEEFFKQQANPLIAKKLDAVSNAQLLQKGNVQKRFVLESLNL